MLEDLLLITWPDLACSRVNCVLKLAFLQRLGSNDSSMANDQTIQALQGLTFGGSNDGIGIGLALLQARSQAANQSQVWFLNCSHIILPTDPPQ